MKKSQANVSRPLRKITIKSQEENQRCTNGKTIDFINANIKQVALKNGEKLSKKRTISAAELASCKEGRKRKALGDISNAISESVIPLTRKKVTGNAQPTKSTKTYIPKLKISKGTSNLRDTRKQNTKPIDISSNLTNNHEIDNASASSNTASELSNSGDSIDNELKDNENNTIQQPKECEIKSGLLKEKLVDQSERTLPEGVKPFDLDTDIYAVSEYVASIFKNMKIRERKYLVKNYMTENSPTTPNNRAILVDWLVEVQENFELYHETLYLAVKIVDFYLQNNETSKEHLQLVGATSLLIACKLEERHPPPIDDFQFICDDAFSHKQFVEMELKIFNALDFDINLPISYRFLRRYSRVTSMSMEILTLARYILELSLHASIFVPELPSKMAAACLCLALKMKDEGPWDINLSYHTGYEEKDLTDLLKNLNQIAKDAPESELQTVRTKYSHPIFFQVAKTNPLLEL